MKLLLIFSTCCVSLLAATVAIPHVQPGEFQLTGVRTLQILPLDSRLPNTAPALPALVQHTLAAALTGNAPYAVTTADAPRADALLRGEILYQESPEFLGQRPLLYHLSNWQETPCYPHGHRDHEAGPPDKVKLMIESWDVIVQQKYRAQSATMVLVLRAFRRAPDGALTPAGISFAAISAAAWMDNGNFLHANLAYGASADDKAPASHTMPCRLQTQIALAERLAAAALDKLCPRKSYARITVAFQDFRLNALLEASAFPETLDYCTRALRTNPASEEYQYAQAIAYEALGQRDTARTAYRRLFYAHPLPAYAAALARCE